MRVLVVEDEQPSAESLSRDLRRYGHHASAVSSGRCALREYRSADLVLMRLELPDMDGAEVIRRIRSSCDTPIISLTYSGEPANRVRGLQAGSDDCLTQPCGFPELLARIEAVMRRVRPWQPVSRAIVRGGLRIDAAMRQVTVDGVPVELTRKEFDLLHYLASRPRLVIPRRQLMAEVWETPMTHLTGMQASRTIDTHVSSLRAKLGSSDWILTVRGVGFRIGDGGRLVADG
ncbi:response regulator transcription factor [Streptomyces sp. TRM 70351]|uniref:response regulator transcription factor n=1 Tax=Streptomyces sp. TRM 70351 TaxID=3116552 RepID=UPI002E7AC41B|nr:response regulator transcription factor [Streptomyces sp. TRM 70351]MEE1930425.1 response regulator transcription factor [Streptomyces sp. TRM 70351]